jgi:NitT/TauT family transport system permease protein
MLVWQAMIGVVFLAAWESASRSGGLDPFFFSRPSDVAIRLWAWTTRGTIWPHVLTTFVEATLSFAIGALCGVVAGFVLARAPFLSALFDPYIRIGNALPRVVLAPIFLLWFGLGIWSKVALGVTVVFFVVFFNTYRGVREVERVIIDNARMLGASERQLVRHVLIPSALTWIFSSLHVSIGLAIIAVVVGEYLGASQGIGYVIAQAEGVFDTTGVFAGMTILAAGVLLIGAAVNRLERRLLSWRPDRSDVNS